MSIEGWLLGIHTNELERLYTCKDAESFYDFLEEYREKRLYTVSRYRYETGIFDIVVKIHLKSTPLHDLHIGYGPLSIFSPDTVRYFAEELNKITEPSFREQFTYDDDPNEYNQSELEAVRNLDMDELEKIGADYCFSHPEMRGISLNGPRMPLAMQWVQEIVWAWSDLRNIRSYVQATANAGDALLFWVD